MALVNGDIYINANGGRNDIWLMDDEKMKLKKKSKIWGGVLSAEKRKKKIVSDSR